MSGFPEGPKTVTHETAFHNRAELFSLGGGQGA